MTNMQGNALPGSMLSAALAYAQRGWAVFPLRPGSKEPLFSSVHPGKEGKAARVACRPPVCGQLGHGLWDATRDLATITAWWTAEPYANIGIATGLSDLLVVDIDTKGAKPGAQTLADLVAEHGQLPPTFAVRTWSGGWHYYFSMPAQRLRNSAGTESAGLGPSIDTRGDGGYVLAPPSIVRENGAEGVYGVLTDAPVTALPGWIENKLSDRKAGAPFISPGKPSSPRPSYVPVTDDGFPVDPDTGVVMNTFQGTPPGLQRKVERACKEIRELPVDGPGEEPVNRIAFSLSHYVPHQLDLESLRAQLQAAVDTWETGHDKGYEGIEHGLRDAGSTPKVYRTQDPTSGRTGAPESGRNLRRTEPQEDVESLPDGFLPPPYVPDEVVDHLLPNWQRDGLLTLRMWRDDWMRWRTTHWRVQSRASIRAEVYPLLKGRSYKDGAGATKKWGATRAKVADLLEVMEAVTYLDQDVAPGSWFDGDGPSGIVAMSNGLLDIRTRELLPHTPRYFNTSSLPFEYDANAPEPAEFMKFLASVWENDQQSIQTFLEWAAYVLSGRTDLQKMLLLIGPKRSGKGTLARIMTALVGKENVGGPSLADFGKQFGLEDLVDKPLAIIGDARMPSSGEREILGNLLSISGEDTIRADRKHRDAWVGRLATRITILSNELPSFADSSGAIASRFVILRMTKSFIGKEDKDLEQRLMAELPSIFNLVLDAGRGLELRGHLVEPDSSETARSILSDTTSPIEVFLEECCEENPDPEASTKTEWIFWAWEDWCNSSGRGSYIGTKEGFAKRLLSARPGVRRTRPRVDGAQVPHYQGVLLIASLMTKCEKREIAQKAAAIAAESGLSQGLSWGQQTTFPQAGWGETR